MRNRNRQTRVLRILMTVLMFFSLITPGFVSAESKGSPDKSLRTSNVAPSEKLADNLLDKFAEEDQVSFIVKFTEKADIKAASKLAKEKAKQQSLSAYRQDIAQRSAIISELKTTAFESQGNAISILEAERGKGNASELRSLHIVNSIEVTATKEVAEKLANLKEVEKIVANEFRVHPTADTLNREKVEQSDEKTLNKVEPSKKANEESNKETSDENNLQASEWNVDRVNAPDVWSLGFDGSGVIVGVMDTGVEWDHPALKEKYLGYDSETGEVDHTKAFFDPAYEDEEAYDLDGHGSHVAGTMVGSEEDGSNQVGVAPGAQWVAVQAFSVVDGDVGAYDADLIAGAEWFLAPGGDVTNAPSVVNNSWGGGPGIDEFFMEAVDVWRESGIVPVFAAGNVTLSNPGGPGSVSSPGNYPQSFGVGNTDRDDMVAPGSLRGPSPYDEIKPDIAAPGSGIRSSVPGGGYASFSGTSMAAPAVSGVIALLIEAGGFSGGLEEQVDQIEEILTATARERTDSEYPDSPNNGYGHGIVDAFAAVTSVSDGLGTITGHVTQEGEDTTPPEYNHTPPNGMLDGYDLNLSIEASDDVAVTSVELVYDGNTVDADLVSGNVKNGEYEAFVPSEDITGDSFTYHWVINDYGNNEVVTDEYTIEITEPILFENFDEDPEWGVFVGGADSSWEWGVPTSGPGSAKTGENVYATNLSGNYYGDEFSWLEMPALSIPEGSAFIEIEHWFDVDPTFAQAVLVVGNDPNEDYQVLDIFSGESGGWVEGIYDISDFTGDDIYIAFVLETILFGDRDGWYIDNVMVTDLPIGTSSTDGKSQVMEEEGLPLDATVSVLESNRSVNTDPANGSYSILHSPGDLTVVAESYGFASEERSVTLPEDETVVENFVLEELAKGNVSGTVTNERTGAPVEDATLLLVEDSNVEPVETDADGNYNLSAYEGTYTLRVMAHDYISQEVEVTIEGDQTVDFELEPFYTVPGDEIGYDGDYIDNARVYYDAGNGWAVRMSLPEGVDTAIVTDGVYQFYDEEFPVPGGTEFAVEVWSAGDDNMPDEKLAGPIEAEAIRDLDQWTVVDLRDEGIQVEGDFFMVYMQTQDNPDAPALATDETDPYAGRSYTYVDGSWDQSDPDHGNYKIRARIAVGVGDPVITSPEEGLITNEEEQTVEGTATPNTTVKLFNNDDETGEMDIGEDGEFSFDINLTEGDNVLKAESYVEDEMATESETVTVTLDTIAPDITITSPEDGDQINTETVVVEGIAEDEHLDYVEVNGEVADLSGEEFSQRIMLDQGENEIEVVAYDEAGNSSAETITVTAKYDGPVIEGLEPSEDQYLDVGETLKVEFYSEPGLDASFSILMPQGKSGLQSDDLHDIEMDEAEEGHYVGYYTVTSNISVSGGTVKVTATDDHGNKATAESEGKLYLNEIKSVDRVKGSNRYETAIAISQEGWESSDKVVLARGDDFADALAGVPLAYALDAPILLTRGDDLLPETEAEIERLGATEVIVLGGSLAISEDISNDLQDNDLEVTRLSGETRYDTAAEIARYLAPEGADQVFVASGLDFPDALSVAPYAAKAGMPIVLTKDDQLPDQTAEVLDELGVSKTYVLGGYLAISDDVVAELPDASRIKGQSRFETNLEIVDTFGEETSKMYVATGLDYADVLTGAVLAAKNDSGILLVRETNIPESVGNFISDSDLNHLTIFGGTLAVNEEVEEQLLELLQ